MDNAPVQGSTRPTTREASMNMFGIIAIIAILIVGAIIFFIRNQNATPPSATTPPVSTPLPTESSTIPSTQTQQITIQNLAFSPNTVTIPVGTTVTWTNNDSVDHSVNSATFNSQVLHTGDSFSYTFTAAGQYAYTCGIHPNMTGTVIVQ